MTHDQADELRELVRRSGTERCSTDSCGPVGHGGPPSRGASRTGQAGVPLLVVGGGRMGVGASTVALGLARALVESGKRVVLVDAELQSCGLTRQTAVQAGGSLSDVLTGSRKLAEVLVPLAAGLQLVAASSQLPFVGQMPAAAEDRLLTQLANLDREADVVIVDTGAAHDPFVRRLWKAAALAVAVTTIDTATVMDTYALIKLLHSPSPQFCLGTLVNQAAPDAPVEPVQQRLAQACARFLGVEAFALGSLPHDANLADVAVAAATVGSYLAPTIRADWRRLATRVLAVLPALPETVRTPVELVA